jgi:hypothetical protein
MGHRIVTPQWASAGRIARAVAGSGCGCRVWAASPGLARPGRHRRGRGRGRAVSGLAAAGPRVIAMADARTGRLIW